MFILYSFHTEDQVKVHKDILYSSGIADQVKKDIEDLT